MAALAEGGGADGPTTCVKPACGTLGGAEGWLAATGGNSPEAAGASKLAIWAAPVWSTPTCDGGNHDADDEDAAGEVTAAAEGAGSASEMDGRGASAAVDALAGMAPP